MKTSKFSVMLLSITLGMASVGSVLHAQIINTLNIDFQPGTNLDSNPNGGASSISYSGTAADMDTGGSGTLWNIVAPTTDGNYNQYNGGTGGVVTSGALSATNLLNSDGSASTVTLSGTDTGGNLAAYATNNTGAVAQDAIGLMADYIIAQNDSTQSITLSGLTAGDEYDLYLYGAGDRNLRQTSFTVDGVPQSTTGVSGTHDLTLGEDYVEFEGTLTTSSLTIDYTSADPGGPNYSPEGEFNGLQITTGNIEAVPEPSSCALLLAGGLALVFFTYRTRQRTV